ncbi:MAG: phenylalanine 4-monooxygenase [Gammaproteobacteria bacterium]|nr:phenylalanine 4-monooxygenase [Gammaproteobacteria bacterium]
MTSYTAKWPDKNGLIHWSDTENKTWHTLITRQNEAVKNRACDQYLDGLAALKLPQDTVPQLSDVNKILKKTNWEMIPVHGTVLISAFFTMLKNRQFPVANFIRTPEELDYLQQPDVFHELFGHGPLLLNPLYADFMAWYGAMALECSPKKRKILSRLFWYTIEFGLINNKGGLRILGGGILSSYAETLFSLESDKPQRYPFDINKVLRTDYDYQSIQPNYFILNNLEQLFELQSDALLMQLKDIDEGDVQKTFINC